jgi:RNase H-fold protein (predicted Holliday junction resolvase)
MRKPITQKAKSPLKQTDEVTLGTTTTSTSAGEDITTEVSKPGKVIGSGYSGKKMSNEAWKKYLANETPEQKAKRHAREVNDGVREAATTETIVTKGDPVTTTEKEQYTPQIRDKTTAITPWENRFNMRTARQSERFSRNEAKRDLRRNANEASRRARRDDGMSYADSKRLKRNIMKGDNLDDKQQTLYDASRGLNKEANTVYSTDAQQSQFDQAAMRGESVDGTARNVNVADIGTSTGQTVLANNAKTSPDAKVDVKTKKVKSAAAMRYKSNVGIKPSSAMKKGYFKGK